MHIKTNTFGCLFFGHTVYKIWKLEYQTRNMLFPYLCGEVIHILKIIDFERDMKLTCNIFCHLKFAIFSKTAD